MAQISRRFENPNGRTVESVPAEVPALSAWFTSNTKPVTNNGVRVCLKTTGDERRITVSLTHAEIDWIVQYRAEMDEKYGRPD